MRRVQRGTLNNSSKHRHDGVLKRYNLNQEYIRKVCARLLQETLRFGAEQIIAMIAALGTLGLQIAARVAKPSEFRPSVWSIIIPYAAIIICFGFYQLLRVPALIYADQQREINDLREKITALTPPRRTAAQQHDFDTASAALKLLGGTGKTALRFLRQRGSLTYGFPVPSSTIPQGLNITETMWVYNHCAAEGVLACEEKPGTGVKTFSIPSTMVPVLDELLFH